jgi:hypothetical protein
MKPRLDPERAARKAQRRTLKSDSLPHSWSLRDWPVHVYPNNSAAGRNFIRKHRSALEACGALTRVDRQLTVLGAGFAIFLAGKMANVAGYQIPPNRSRAEREVAA